MAAKFAEIFIKLGLKKEGFDKEVKKTSTSMEDMGKSILKTGAIIGGMATGAILAGKAIWSMAEQGAKVIQTGESFEFLLEKLDLAPDLLEQLREASRGTVDDMTLMSGTATLLAGTTDALGKAMGDATPQLMKIAKAANKLNPALGDTAFMYSSIATGVKRAQPLILDNLGLTIKLGAANSAMAESLGKTVEQLTAEEKAMAILNATLEAGDLLIDQVGGSTEAAGDAMAELEVNVKNIKDTLLTKLAPAVRIIAEDLNEMKIETGSSRDAFLLLINAHEKGLITLEQVKKLDDLYTDGLIDQEEIVRQLTVAEKNRDKQLGITADMSKKVKDKTIELGGAYDSARVAGELARYEMENLAGAADNMSSEFAEAIGITVGLKASMQKFNEQLLFNRVAQNMSEEAALKLGIALGVVDTKTMILDAALPGLIEKWDKNKDGIIDNKEAAAGFTAELLGIGNAINDLPDYKKIGIEIDVYGDRIPLIPKKGIPAIPLQHGTSFTVPGGYPNDSFFLPMALSSGEHVQVTPKGKRGGGNTYNYVRYGDQNFVQNSAAAAFLVEKQHQAEFDEIDKVI